ncbi:hypothetical protein GEMRC1_001050 [Eukaryota sp. GEM-RC1]
MSLLLLVVFVWTLASVAYVLKMINFFPFNVLGSLGKLQTSSQRLDFYYRFSHKLSFTVYYSVGFLLSLIFSTLFFSTLIGPWHVSFFFFCSVVTA